MENEKFISIEDCCRVYSIETAFIKTLNENGLLELQLINETYFLDQADLFQLEKFVHLHYDLEINIAGIEAISHLLERIQVLQTELRMLRGQ